jgi:hypothetical protein
MTPSFPSFLPNVSCGVGISSSKKMHMYFGDEKKTLQPRGNVLKETEEFLLVEP